MLHFDLFEASVKIDVILFPPLLLMLKGTDGVLSKNSAHSRNGLLTIKEHINFYKYIVILLEQWIFYIL